MKRDLYYDWVVGAPSKWGNRAPAKWGNTPCNVYLGGRLWTALNPPTLPFKLGGDPAQLCVLLSSSVEQFGE